MRSPIAFTALPAPAGSPADAIVIRADAPDARYRVSPAVLSALAELPGEGHGALIAPRWIGRAVAGDEDTP